MKQCLCRILPCQLGFWANLLSDNRIHSRSLISFIQVYATCRKSILGQPTCHVSCVSYIHVYLSLSNFTPHFQRWGHVELGCPSVCLHASVCLFKWNGLACKYVFWQFWPISKPQVNRIWPKYLKNSVFISKYEPVLTKMFERKVQKFWIFKTWAYTK